MNVKVKVYVCLRHVHAAAFVIAILAFASAAAAQTSPPAPNFSIRSSPNLFMNVWPADFNRDGRTDLIAGTGPPLGTSMSADLVVAIGRGDGTFKAARSLGIAAYPVGTGDFNRDSRIDVLLVEAERYSVLPGNGNGTFGAPIAIGPAIVGLPFHGSDPFAVVADFNNDGRRDVAVPGATTSGDAAMLVYPGNGDFSFGPAVELPITGFGVEGISGDFDEDGRRDLAVVTVCCSAVVFLNRGGLLFEAREIDLADDLGDITTADINGDSHLDLLVAASFVGGPFPSQDGSVIVVLGNGDGTFRPKTVFNTGVRGEITIVAGDFNADGHIDVATGNWSVLHEDEFGNQLWDSISIMPGDGTGQLLRATTYALGRTNQGETDAVWMFTHNSLNTSDLNGDRRTDLIASPGAILLNRPPAPNRTPSVFAGPDHTVYEEAFNLHGLASDPDRHWLTYAWSLSGGEAISNVPFIRVGAERGTHVFTFRVDDGHGGTVSDSVRITVANPDLDPVVGLYVPEPSPGGGPVTLRWDASSDRGLTRFDLWWSTTGGRSWGRIAECTALPATARSCVTANTGVTDAVLRIVATDRFGRQWIVLQNYPFPTV